MMGGKHATHPMMHDLVEKASSLNQILRQISAWRFVAPKRRGQLKLQLLNSEVRTWQGTTRY